ncbi:MAG: phosphatidylserine decarboxylase [Candidatus Hermodarchaeota archaeon]
MLARGHFIITAPITLLYLMVLLSAWVIAPFLDQLIFTLLFIVILIGTIGLFFIFYFFRDPNRIIPEVPENSILSPADGTIYQIVSDSSAKELIIRIRMSFLNVHVNRAPIDAKVLSITWKKGANWPMVSFIHRSSLINSRKIIEMEANIGDRVFPLTLVQITGIWARRLVFYPKESEFIRRGTKIGAILLGSESDIHIPSDSEILVKIGQHVQAGITTLAYLPLKK